MGLMTPFEKQLYVLTIFDSNIARLLRGGDCWRVSKSLELIQNIVGDDYDDFLSNANSAEIFDSLASIILQSPISLLGN
jgi:hypothetical protein